MDGDLETARRSCGPCSTDDLEPLRRPDGHMPPAFGLCSLTAALVGDREAGARLRPLLEPLRRLRDLPPPPRSASVSCPSGYIGRLELLAGRPDAAVPSCAPRSSGPTSNEIVWAGGLVTGRLARALHRRATPTERAASLDEAEAWPSDTASAGRARAAEARAEIEGREPPSATGAAAERHRADSRSRVRAAAGARCGDGARPRRRALERRFAEPRRQRALVKALARGFQPSHAAGFSGTIAYELEPFAIAPPPDAPWRWAIEVDSRAGRARLIEPAPLDAAVTIHIGLADWVRVIAGVEDALTVMVAGRCGVEGDVTLALRLEAMFGAR